MYGLAWVVFVGQYQAFQISVQTGLLIKTYEIVSKIMETFQIPFIPYFREKDPPTNISLYVSKGQLFSKCLFGVFNFPKKRTKQCPGCTGQMIYLT